MLSVMALRASPVLLERSRALLASNLELMNAFFARWSALFDWSPPAAGSVAFPRLLTGESARSFCLRVLSETNVLLLPSSVYDHCVEGEERFRISIARRDCEAVLSIFEAWLEAGGSKAPRNAA
jgi:aspartate/methionine/tyrosine aminotransferase